MICCVTITNVVSFLVDSCQAQSVKGIDDVSVVVASVVNVNKRNKRIIIVTIIVIVVLSSTKSGSGIATSTTGGGGSRI